MATFRSKYIINRLGEIVPVYVTKAGAVSSHVVYLTTGYNNIFLNREIYSSKAAAQKAKKEYK